MNVHLQTRPITESDLRDALSDGALDLHYQPIVHLREARVSGCEALLRWHHPVRGTISPTEFVPVAEQSGLIDSIGEWALQRACAEATSWPHDIQIAVNLSPRQISSPTLVPGIASALAEAGLSPRRLELEITESMLLVCNDSTITTLNQLRDLGVRVVMDDFGTGYSSLSYLRAFPFDKLKIDQSFVRELGDSERCTAIVRAIIGLGSGLGVATVAEGVETIEQLQHLKAHGCDEVQGYLFSPPLPSTEIRQFLKTWRPTNFVSYMSFLLQEDDLLRADRRRC